MYQTTPLIVTAVTLADAPFRTLSSRFIGWGLARGLVDARTGHSSLIRVPQTVQTPIGDDNQRWTVELSVDLNSSVDLSCAINLCDDAHAELVDFFAIRFAGTLVMLGDAKRIVRSTVPAYLPQAHFHVFDIVAFLKRHVDEAAARAAFQIGADVGMVPTRRYHVDDERLRLQGGDWGPVVMAHPRVEKPQWIAYRQGAICPRNLVGEPTILDDDVPRALQVRCRDACAVCDELGLLETES